MASALPAFNNSVAAAAAVTFKLKTKPAADRGVASDGLGLETVGQSARLPTDSLNICML
jgi:hypothetical protein